jgi:hypothetical protein
MDMGLFSNPLGYAGYPANSQTAQKVNSTVRSATPAEALAGVLNDVYISPATYTGSGSELGPRTLHGVILGEGPTNALGATAAGTTGQVLTATTSANPAFAAIGTNSGLTAHGVLLAEGTSAFAATSAGSVGQVLTAANAADPVFAAIGTNSGLTTHGVVIAEGTGAFVSSIQGVTGTVFAGVTSNDPTFVPITELNVVDDTGSSQSMAYSTTYIADNATGVTYTLPTLAPQGTQINIIGNGAGGWVISQNASQNIKMNNLTTTTGTGGSMSSTNRYNCVNLICTVANTTWVVRSFSGTFTFV